MLENPKTASGFLSEFLGGPKNTLFSKGIFTALG